MFQHTSRYYSLETAQLTTPDGRSLAYKRRRFLPAGDQMPLLAEVTATRDDRLDLITAQTLGDPEQFWQIGDANNAMYPPDLLTEPVQVLRIPMPQV
jgi:nucleoid-associated protein YgaU